MKRIQLGTLVLGGLVMVLSACSDSTASSVPKVSKTYQQKIEAAWNTASQGKSPTMDCASVIGTAVGMNMSGQGKQSEAAQAYETCYVSSFAHYANTLIAQPDNAALDSDKQPKGCMALFTQSRIHQSSLGGFAKDFGLDKTLLDAKVRSALDQGPAVACTMLFAED
ncbi:hypothetical protein H0A58_03445 [Alcaligenaceae bacterium]|nr:hypothetical protein [Alcaligenaceae bacterium]